jgi:hypothetical protein
MANPTPGSWHLGYAKSGAQYIYADGQEQPIRPNVRVNKSTTKEIVAYATLMAAAPDLLRQLEAIVVQIEHSGRLFVPPGVQAAINKARGL